MTRKHDIGSFSGEAQRAHAIVGEVDKTTNQEKIKARCMVARLARDAVDCHLLLEILGLLD